MNQKIADDALAFHALMESLVQGVREGKVHGELSSISIEVFQTTIEGGDKMFTVAKVWGLGDPIVLVNNGDITWQEGSYILAPMETMGDSDYAQKHRKKYPSRADRFAEAQGNISAGQSEMENLRDELEDWKDNMPENLQGSNTYEMLEEATSVLEDIISQAEEAASTDVGFPGMYAG